MTIVKDSSIYTSRDYWTRTPVTSPNLKRVGDVVLLPRTRTGTIKPNWRFLVANDLNATTGMDAEYVSHTDMPGHMIALIRYPLNSSSRNAQEFSVKGRYASVNHSVPGTPGDYAELAMASNKAATAYFKKAQEITAQLHGLVVLGELRETLHMLRHPAKALYDDGWKYLNALGKRKRASPKSWHKAVPGLWLEHAFGWMPLINDAQDAYKAYNRVLADKKVVHFSVGGRATKDLGQSETTSTEVSYLHWRKVSKEWVTRTVRYRGVCVNKLEGSPMVEPALFGFTPSEFIPTVWELLPWSFLVDYFVNVGDVLTSTTASTTGVGWTNKTVINARTKLQVAIPDEKATLAQVGTDDLVSIRSQSCFSKYIRRVVNRSASAEVPYPTLAYQGPLSQGQLLNCAALLTYAKSNLHEQSYPKHLLDRVKPFRV